MNVHAVVMCLIGPIAPVGDTNIDRERLANCQSLTLLVDKLVNELHYIQCDAKSHMHSVKQVGEHARDFLVNLRDALDDHVEEGGE